MDKKNLFEKIASVLTNNIPGKGISNFLFQQIQQLQSKKDYEEFSDELKKSIGNIDSLTQFELVNLATGLYAAFESSREYKQGWIVDGYWEVYNKCNSANKTVLTSVSGW